MEPYRSSGHGLRNEPMAIKDSGHVGRLRVTNKVGHDVDRNQVLEDFEVEEIMGSHYNAEGNQVLYLMKWKKSTPPNT